MVSFTDHYIDLFLDRLPTKTKIGSSPTTIDPLEQDAG